MVPSHHGREALMSIERMPKMSLKIRFHVTLATILVASLSTTSHAADYELVRIPAGSTGNVYFEVNMSGQVFLSIRDTRGPACANLWWIKWPLGW